MRKEILQALIISALIILFFSVGFYFQEKVNEKNWWTDVLCESEGGELYDVTSPFSQYYKCIINGEEHRAYFGVKEKCSNYTSYGCRKLWSLETIDSHKSRKAKEDVE